MGRIKEFLTGEQFKENLWRITEYVANGIGIAIPVIVTMMCEKAQKRETSELNLLSSMFSTVNYDSAVASIMSSTLFDNLKVQVLGLLKKDQPEAYYKAVTSIINSSMLRSRKIEAIEKLNRN